LALPSLVLHGPLIRSALDEAAAATILGPAAIVGLQTASCPAAELPDGLVPLATFELLGTGRRPVAAILDPTLGTQLGGTAVSIESLGLALLEALDGALEAVVGEGLGLGPADGLPGDEELLLVRFGLSSTSGPDVEPEVGVVAIVAAAARADLATHLTALEALGPTAAGDPVHDADATDALIADGLAAAGAAAIVDLTPAARAIATGSAPHVVATAPPAGPIRAVDYPTLPPAPAPTDRQSLDLLLGVSLEVTVEIGRARLAIRDVLSLAPGSIVELDKLAGEKVDVLVNRHRVATGEVVVVDENFGVRITEVVARERRIQQMDGRA
jgi:flagellar motor switch protein FliN